MDGRIKSGHDDGIGREARTAFSFAPELRREAPTWEPWLRSETPDRMKRLFDFFRRKPDAGTAAPPAQFFCLYCNAKFSYEDLERVVAHLKPHVSREEAEARLDPPPHTQE